MDEDFNELLEYQQLDELDAMLERQQADESDEVLAEIQE